MTNEKNQFDLEERTAKLGEDTIKLVKKIPNDAIIFPIISQLIRASTSIGANYCEADNAESKKDFIHKAHICKKEAKESKYWLSLIDIYENKILETERIRLIQEATELTNIFGSIIRKSE